MEPQSPGETKQSPQQSSEARQSHGILKLVLIAIILAVLAAVLVGGYSNIIEFLGISTNQQQQFVQVPEGLLVISVAEKSAGSSTARIIPKRYSLAQGELEYVPVEKLAASPDGVNLAYQHVFSGSGRYVTFVGAVDIEEATSFSDIPMQIYRTDVSETMSSEDFNQRLLNAKSITKGIDVVRQSPSISNQGNVLYMAHAPEDPQTLLTSQASDWEIRFVGLDEKEFTLTEGTYPKWAAFDRFVFLKNDGLYLYTLADDKVKKIWGTQGVATKRMTLDVSDDYQYVAWVAPEVSTVHIFRVLNWGTGGLTLKGTISAPAIGAIFSPDSRFIAVQMVGPGETPGETTPIIGYYDIETLSTVSTLLTLNGMGPNQTYLTDWRP